MFGHRYVAYNHGMVTTAAFVPVAFTTNLRTQLQIAVPSTRKLYILEWGYRLDAAPSAASKIELLDTDVAATTGTAHIASGVQPLDPDLPASLVTLGTGATGYTFAAEGATTASRSHDDIELPANCTTAFGGTTYKETWLPHTAPVVDTGRFLRVRTHMGSAVNGICWVKWGE